MGTALVHEAMVRRLEWPQVSGRGMHVLLRMCAQALDTDSPGMPAHHYFGGWVPLAMMLGYPPPIPDAPLTGAPKQAVRRAIKELTDAGLIKSAGPDIQAQFRNHVYVITL